VKFSRNKEQFGGLEKELFSMIESENSEAIKELIKY